MRKREVGTEMGCGKKKEMEEQGREVTGRGEKRKEARWMKGEEITFSKDVPRVQDV